MYTSCQKETLLTFFTKKMFAELSEFMKDDTSLTLTVLDALSNLNASEKVVLCVVNDVLDKLNSANVADVPVMVKFLMQSAND